jgi:transposase
MEKEIRQNVGIDVAKADFKVALSVQAAPARVVVRGSRTFPNTPKGFEALQRWALERSDRQAPLHFTMEATGVYYEGLAYFLHEAGYRVHVVLPNLARKYSQSLGLRAKTDRVDACMLGQLGVERDLRAWLPASSQLRTLRQLTRERDALVCQRTVAANHLHAYTHQGKPLERSVARCRERMAFLDAQIGATEQEMKELVEDDPQLQKKLAFLTSIPGVGLLTAATVAAETNGFAAIASRKQLTGYAGLDAKIAESGQWKGKSKISKRGNSHIRKALYMPTFSKIRADAGTRQRYERLEAAKGESMVAAVAEQRKLLCLMFTLWKKEEFFVAAGQCPKKIVGAAAPTTQDRPQGKRMKTSFKATKVAKTKSKTKTINEI